LGADDIKRAYTKHLASLDAPHPEIRVEIMVSDDPGETRKAHAGWDGNPSLIVRKDPVSEARAEVRPFPHLPGDGYNHVSWGATSCLESLTDTERKALSAAFDEIILATVPRILNRLKADRRKQARASVSEFVAECNAEIKELRSIV